MLFPAEFDFIFPFNFCTDLRLTSNPCQIYMHIAGSLCDTGFPYTFYGEKICSALYVYLTQISLTPSFENTQTKKVLSLKHAIFLGPYNSF